MRAPGRLRRGPEVQAQAVALREAVSRVEAELPALVPCNTSWSTTGGKLLAGYTIVNLMELENGGEPGGPITESRFARRAIESEHIGLSHFRYAPNGRYAVGHTHREQEEVYLVLSGAGRLKLDDELLELRPWDVVRVAPGIFRAFAAGPEGLELIAIGSDRPEGGDVEHTGEEFWGD
jgi:mannose-6-phosphate isomerase-like protein (cupin superfamily)